MDGCCIELSCSNSRDKRPKKEKGMYVCMYRKEKTKKKKEKKE